MVVRLYDIHGDKIFHHVRRKVLWQPTGGSLAGKNITHHLVYGIRQGLVKPWRVDLGFGSSELTCFASTRHSLVCSCSMVAAATPSAAEKLGSEGWQAEVQDRGRLNSRTAARALVERSHSHTFQSSEQANFV